MKRFSRAFAILYLVFAFLSTGLPCGPGYVTPLFDTSSAPETPYSEYASGRLGIVKPTFRRSVLFAAYRYIAAGGLSGAEQNAMVEVWKAEINNKDFRDDSVDAAVKAWVDKRRTVVGKEEKVPEIYAERTYGGYDFFPNCTKNAFETASETLADRVFSHGPSDANVGNWVKAQDEVFENCSNGKQTPEPAPIGAPDWLQKDRAYQIAAASFYSLDYRDAKRRFAEIAQDSESPWRETADYLVARTLIRQASLSKTPETAAPFYDEAETHLQRFISSSGKFTGSAERLMGLIAYRRHPKERVSELAKKLAFNSGNDNFRQDVIDYNWLLDKFESEVLTAEQKRKEAAKTKESNENSTIPGANAVKISGDDSNSTPITNRGRVKKDDELDLILYEPNNSQSWHVFVREDATDDDVIAAAEKVVGRPLTDVMKKNIREARQSAYAARFSADRKPDYEGGYWGEEKMTPSLVPDFVRRDDLSDWLYTFQMRGAEAYLYSLKKFRESKSELWLMTALSKADKSSTELPRLIEAAGNVSRMAAAYPTIAYHLARILLSQGKNAEARKLIDGMLDAGDAIPVTARNSFISLKLNLTETLEDWLRYSLKKPYAFDFDGSVGSVDDIIAEQKKWYDPETNKDGREAYEAGIEDEYKQEKLWQSREMFDTGTIEVMNQHFPTASLIEVLHSSTLPDYLRERFAVAVWTRAYLLDNYAMLLTITPEVAKYHPEFEPLLAKITAAKTQGAMDYATLYFVLKNPIVTPYIEDGIGKTDNETSDFDSNDWWCGPYDRDEDGGTEPKTLPSRPKFLTAAQSKTAQAERKRLKDIGDAPKFLGAKVLAWAKAAPLDRRVPEALYIMAHANGWTKYGCGNDEETHDALIAFLKKHFPGNPWTVKLAADESEK